MISHHIVTRLADLKKRQIELGLAPGGTVRLYQSDYRDLLQYIEMNSGGCPRVHEAWTFMGFRIEEAP